MVRFFLNGQVFNNPKDWDGFSTEFKRDYAKRIISVQYTDRITFTGAAYSYILTTQQTDGYCAEINLRVEEQCGNGPWLVLARGKIIMADCEWNETKCSVQCSVVDNGIGARVDNNKKVPVSPLAINSKNNNSLVPVSPIALTMFKASDGTALTGTRRAFDWFDSLAQALNYITDGTVTITSNWYTNLPDDKRYAIAVAPELRTAGFTVPRISWTFDELFNELSKKHNLWIFPTEDASGNPFLILEPEDYFLGPGISNTILNIEDLTRKMDPERLYATVDVGSDEAILELLSANPLPFVVLLGFTRETFHFKGVCNTSASLDLVNKWIIDTNVIYQIAELDNDEYDDKTVIIQYDRTTATATAGNYLFQGATPYLYNEELLSINVLPRFPLPSSVGANYASGFDDSFRAEYADAVAGIEWLTPSLAPTTLYHVRGSNDFTLPNFDTNNVWGNGTTQGNVVSTADSRFTPTAQGLYVFDIGIHWGIQLTYPDADFTGNYSRYSGASVRVHADIYNSLNVLITTAIAGDTTIQYLVGNYFDTIPFAVSLSVGDYVEFWVSGEAGPLMYNFDLGAPVGPTPSSASGFYYGKSLYGLNTQSYIETTAIVSGGVSVATTPSRTLSFTFSRSMTAVEWMDMINNPQDGVMIDGARFVHALTMKRRITGQTTFEMIKQP